MKFEDPEFNGQSIFDLSSKVASTACNAILGICLYGGDYDLAINSIRTALKHENEDVVRCAIISIGHTARLWKKIPEDLVNEVHLALKHKSAYMRGQSNDAMEDIRQFVPKAIT